MAERIAALVTVMNPGPVDWIPALAVLAAGVLLGAVLLWRALAASRRARAVAGVPLQVRDLAAKRDALLLQLREMDDSAGKRTPEQLARERYALELETARILLALGGREAAAPANRSSEEGARTRARPARPASPAPRKFLWAAGSAIALLLLGVFVYRSAKPRERGGSLTGDTQMAARQPNGGNEETQIEAALARNPEDVEAHLARAQLLLARHDLMGVWNETTAVLTRQPGNPRGLAYQAIVRVAMGQNDEAVALLKRALSADPNLITGYAYLAVAYTRMGRTPEADEAIAQASKRFPDQAGELRGFLADLRKEAAAAEASLATDNVGARPVARGDRAGAESRPAASSGRRVAGTIDLDPSSKSAVAPEAVLFVFVRPAGVDAGPPAAVKRLAATFPVAFELTEADSMMGQAFPDRLLIEARLDSDGDPTTRPPTDPKARLDDVEVGRTDLHLVLRRP